MKDTKVRFKKMAAVGMITIIAMLSAAMMTGCENDESVLTPTTTSIATSDETTKTSPTEATLNETDKAIIDAGLKVDDKGNITDANGNKVEVKEDGKVEVKKDDGTTITVDAGEVKQAVENKARVDETNSNIHANNGGSTNSNQNNSSATQKPNQTPTQAPTQAPTQKPTQKSAPTTVDPHAGKTYHEAQYKTVEHPAETKEEWVVDKAAYSYEEPVYEEKWAMICWGCGIDVSNGIMTAEQRTDHMLEHHLKGEPTGYHSGYLTVQTGTRTVEVPEEGHYETVVVKEAWTEKVLVREAGWY